MRFWGFWQKSNQFICTILLEYESTYRFSNSLQKLHDWKKIWSCCNGQEPIRPIRMRNSLNCNISKTSWGMKFDFCLWWGIHWNQQIYPFISSGCGRACQKLCKIATQLYRKNVLSCKANFICMWLRTLRSYRFVQSLQVDMLRHAKCDWKQRVNWTSKMIISMNLVFCLWLDVHKYIYMIQSIHMGVARHTWTCQK